MKPWNELRQKDEEHQQAWAPVRVLGQLGPSFARQNVDHHIEAIKRRQRDEVEYCQANIDANDSQNELND